MSLLSRLAIQAARAYGILSSNPNNVPASYLVVAGGGGGGTTSQGANGSNSVLSGSGITTVTSTGGGGGGYDAGAFGVAGSSGGSGGGGGGYNGGSGAGTSGQGNNGGSASSATGGAGGGGASAVGQTISGATGGAGGAGTASSISGSSVTYAGGGGGGGNPTAGSGGSGGGGNGGTGNSGGAGVSGTANLGGGGGGRGTVTGVTWGSGGGGAGGLLSGSVTLSLLTTYTVTVGAGGSGSGSGGSGVVIISYTSATPKFVGGTLTTSGGNQIHTFTSSGTLSPITPITASYLVVAGGGSGGANAGAGGGAGGLLTSSTTLYSGATYIVTVGAGGAGGAGTVGVIGGNSSILGTGLTTITSTGGGRGAHFPVPTGGNGGSGGGGAAATGATTSGGTGITGQGFAGGTGNGGGTAGAGGGGGSSAVGGNGTATNGGNGGAGTASSISGSSVTYAGGGGGSAGAAGFGGTGGAGGGGAGGGGATNPGASGISGTANTGGGGGGGWQGSGVAIGGNGGSGTVIISYAGSQVFNGGLVTSSGGNTIHTFNATGALTPLTNNLNNSLRFRSSASAFLNRTPTATGNQKTFTWSGWVKRGALGSQQFIHHAFYGDSGRYSSIYFTSSDTLAVQSGVYSTGASTTTSYQYITTQVFRDPSAWYHIVVAVDTTQATSGNRVKVYVNGNQVSAFGTSTAPTQNDNTFFNITTTPMYVGKYAEAPGSSFLDGYLADINWVDGQQLEPYYFGNNDNNGVWKPISYKGTYGPNGYYLTFGNTTSTTTLGFDSSPNGNNWTTNNISLTAGTTYDAMTDVPTNTSATVANYATINPLLSTSNVVLSEANLKAQVGSTGGVYRTAGGTFAVSSGKWYWELVFGNPTTGNPLAGVGDITVASSSWNADTSTNANFWYVDGSNGNKINGTGGPGSSYGSSFTTSDTCMVALDMDNGKIWWGKNGTWFASGDPAAGTNAAYTNLASKLLTIALMGGCGSCGFSGNLYQLNFGQRPFSYTPPTGFVRLNTYNLSTPTILQGNKYMDATLYTGTGASLSVTNAGAFKPDFVWMKRRNTTGNNVLQDSVRGVTKQLFSNSTTAELTGSDDITSFNSNGFTIAGTDTDTGASGSTYVGWQWQAGQGSTSSNTSGSITSTVSVNTTAGFSVVTFTQPASGSFTVGHGLGVAPKMIIGKDRTSASTNWVVYHSALSSPQSNYLTLNTTNAVTSSTNIWNNTAPTSTVISSISGYIANGNSNTVLYCWADVSGYSKAFSYTGNGSTDGPFTYLGFRPKFVMTKRTDTTSDWIIYDTSRNTYNVTDLRLFPNLSNAETQAGAMDLLSNGFKLRDTGASQNASGGTYIGMAFAENPTKISNAR